MYLSVGKFYVKVIVVKCIIGKDVCGFKYLQVNHFHKNASFFISDKYNAKWSVRYGACKPALVCSAEKKKFILAEIYITTPQNRGGS